MDESVLIGKPLGALRPPPPITASEEINAHKFIHVPSSSGGLSAGMRPRPSDCHLPPHAPLLPRLRLGIITRAFIITVICRTDGREQPLRALRSNTA